MSQAWTDDLELFTDYRDPPRFPHDRLAVASVILSSSWLWFAGSLAGLVLGLVAWKRHGSRPQPLTSRRWALTGVSLGAIGMFIFGTVVAPPMFRSIARRTDDAAARASLADLVSAINSSTGQNLHTSPNSFAPWRLPGGSGVVVVGPGTTSTGFKTVSAEVWDLWLPAPPTGRATIYAAVLSSSGTCFYLRDSNSVEYAQRSPLSEPCSGDDARGISDWSTTP